jgi:hypothetical protein
VQPGTTREAIIARFGEPTVDEKNPKFEGGDTSIDEIIYYHILFRQLPPSPNGDWVFSGFQVRLKEGKAVVWMSSHAQ